MGSSAINAGVSSVLIDGLVTASGALERCARRSLSLARLERLEAIFPEWQSTHGSSSYARTAAQTSRPAGRVSSWIFEPVDRPHKAPRNQREERNRHECVVHEGNDGVPGWPVDGHLQRVGNAGHRRSDRIHGQRNQWKLTRTLTQLSAQQLGV